MAKPFSPEVKAAIRHLVADKGIRSARVIADRLGINPYHARNHMRTILAELGGGAPQESPRAKAASEPVEPEGVKSFETAGDTAKVEAIIHSGGGVVTEDDLVRVCGIDLSRWRIVRMRVKAYQTGMKLVEKSATVRDETGKATVQKISEKPHVVQLFSVSADLERIVTKPLEAALDAVFDRYREKAPYYPPLPASDGDTLLEFDLFDVHFGKLAWRGETGQDYDLRIAEAVFAQAVEDLLAESAGIRPERIIVPFGNDYVHTDSGRNETTSGTVVDTDGRRAKIYEVALMAFVRAIERMRRVAPVDVVLVRGNHDFDTSLTMAWALKAWFRDTPNVAVDVTPGPRKYRLYGKTLIGYEHGDNLTDAQVRDLPAVMMKEAPREWLAAAEFHEWHIGHRHSERRFTTKDIDTNIGVVTRWLHSLSATDAWHHTKKFIGGRRAAEVLRFHREQGYRGNSLALVRVA